MNDGRKKRGRRLTFHVGDGDARPADSKPQARASEITGEAALELLGQRVLDALDPCYAMDGAGNVIFANQPFRNLQVFAHAEPADSSVANLEAQRAGLVTVDEVYRRIRADLQPLELEERLVSGETPLRYRSHHVPVLDDSGALVGICGLYRNSGSAEANAALAKAAVETRLASVEALADWTWRADVALTLVECSAGFRDATGLEPFLLIGQARVEVGRFEGVGNGENDALARMRARQPFRNAAFRVSAADGTPKLFRLSGMPVFSDDSQQFLGYRGTAMAVEEVADARAAIAALERRLERLTSENQRLDEAREDAARATRTREQFLATVSHELRTPLNAVIGFSEICANELFGDLPEPYLGYARDIFGASSHLMELVNDLLDLARIERDEVVIRQEVTGLIDLIDSAAALVSLEATRKSIDLKIENVDDIDVWVDPVRARQVLVNLINNAVRYSGLGSKITVRASRTRADGTVSGENSVDIVVSDNGPGIPEDRKATIFEPFERADIVGEKDGGLGIGLYISRRLARLMGGDITVANAPEGGARFTVRLPVSTEPRDA